MARPHIMLGSLHVCSACRHTGHGIQCGRSLTNQLSVPAMLAKLGCGDQDVRLICFCLWQTRTMGLRFLLEPALRTCPVSDLVVSGSHVTRPAHRRAGGRVCWTRAKNVRRDGLCAHWTKSLCALNSKPTSSEPAARGGGARLRLRLALRPTPGMSLGSPLSITGTQRR